jgi:hypothetical protein
MCIVPPTNDDKGIIATGNQNVNESGNYGQSPESNASHIAHEGMQHPEHLTNEVQASGMLDIPMTNSTSVDNESISPFAGLPEEGPISPQCAGNAADYLTAKSDIPTYCLHPHPHHNELGSLEGLLDILDMVLEIVNTN